MGASHSFDLGVTSATLYAMDLQFDIVDEVEAKAGNPIPTAMIRDEEGLRIAERMVF